nr:uncharacterized protein LOC116766799 isoform X1 [Danaus plexippus plexippus]
MTHWIVLFILIAAQCATSVVVDRCSHCVGEGYECVDGYCYCSDGYIPDVNRNKCIRCPGLGESCAGTCCSPHKNETLQCWQGICRSCYESLGNWICRDSNDQIILISSSQIVMAVALVLGIIATFSLMYKLCKVHTLSAIICLRTARTSSVESRLSIDSFQIYVDSRLRDAPPKYSSTAPAGSSIYPAAIYFNAGFIHDNSLPPPLYTEERKDQNVPNNAICHI